MATAGGLVFAASFAYILATVGPHPEYTSTFLPGFMLGGIGVGMTLGTLPAAATAELPAGRFATGSAVFGMARQLGSAIGVAVLVALLSGAASGGDLLTGLRHGWWFALGCGVGTALLAIALPALRRDETARAPAGAAAVPR